MNGPDALYKSVVATTPDAIVTMDEAGRIRFANPAAELLFGYSADELLGKRLTMLMPERFRKDHQIGLDRYLKSGTRKLDWSYLRLPGLHRDGREIMLSLSFGEYQDGDQKIFTGILRDISDVIRREAGMAFLLEASEVLTSSLNYEVTLRRVAELATRSIADWATIDLVEHGSLRRVAIVHPDPAKVRLAEELQAEYPTDPASTTGAHHVIRTGERVMMSEIPDDALRAAAVDERHFDLLKELQLRSYICVPLKLRDEVIGALTLVSTLPGRRYTDADADLAAELARRAAVAIDNSKLYTSAQEARIAAEEANAAKSEFLAMMSHELRTPLNAISGYADLLATGVRGELTPEQLADVHSIQRSQAHLLAIINDMLNFAKLEAGKVQFTYVKVPINPLLSGLEELIRPQLRDKSLTYEYTAFDKALTATVDVEKFQQIMLNLLSNAIKFTDKGGKVRLFGRAEGDDLFVSVSDTGRGVPPEKLDDIFEPFVQVEPLHTRVTGGAGLGLAISRDIARTMGGDVSVESEVGRGSTFTLRLPLAGMEPATPLP